MAVLITAMGCSDLLEVDNPDIITPADLEGDIGISVLHAGALRDFALGWNGGFGYVLHTGLLADELSTDTATEELGQMDRRRVDEENPRSETTFADLHRARSSLETAAQTIGGSAVDDRHASLVAELYALAGFTYIAFAEGFCSGVPFSSAPASGGLDAGEPLTTHEMLDIALQRFDSALVNAGNDVDIADLAKVGMGRALVNLGDVETAAATVASVPTTFSYVIEHTVEVFGLFNGVYWMNVAREQFSLADLESGIGLAFRSAQDPRVPWIRDDDGTDVSRDRMTPQYDQLKYTDENASLVLADGVEARLIEGEALLHAGGVSGWLSSLNTLRAGAGMTDLVDPGTADMRLDLHFAERAFWMFATGHRLGDLRRLVRQYGRDPETVFPAGDYFLGGQYGDDMSLPIPKSEENNPNFQGCLSSGA